MRAAPGAGFGGLADFGAFGVGAGVGTLAAALARPPVALAAPLTGAFLGGALADDAFPDDAFLADAFLDGAVLGDAFLDGAVLAADLAVVFLAGFAGLAAGVLVLDEAVDLVFLVVVFAVFFAMVSHSAMGSIASRPIAWCFPARRRDPPPSGAEYTDRPPLGQAAGTGGIYM